MGAPSRPPAHANPPVTCHVSLAPFTKHLPPRAALQSSSVLEIWKAKGATSPDALRTLFVKRSLGKSTTLLIQLALDAGASAFSFYNGVVMGQTQALGDYTLAVQYLAYFIVSTGPPAPSPVCAGWALPCLGAVW